MRLAFLPLALSAVPAAAQEVEILLRENDPLPGVAGSVISGLDTPDTNGIGGWAILLGYDAGGIAIDASFGTPTGGAPAVLFSEQIVGDCDQQSWETFGGIDNAGLVAYSPSCTLISTGATGIDSFFVNAVAVAKEDDPIPTLPGKVYRFNSRPDLTAGGLPTWVGGINDASGTNEGNGLFVGFGASVLYKTGDLVPGLTGALDASAVDFDYRFSPNGAHHILATDVATGSSTDDGQIIMDGAGLMIGGALVGESVLLPAAQQVDPLEAWDNFDYFGVTDDGSYMMTGDTDGPLDTDEFVLVDGQILFRESDVVDGFILEDFVSMAGYSDRKDLAFVFETDDGTTTDPEVLFFNGRPVLAEGSAIDFDGDGTIDPMAILRDFTGINALSVGADRAIYVTADIDTLGTSSSSDDTEVLFRVQMRELVTQTTQHDLSDGGSIDLRLYTPRDVNCDLYWVFGSLSGTAPGTPVGGGLTLPLNVDAYTTLTATKPNTAIHTNTFGAPDALGTADASVNLPAGLDPSLAGGTLSYAYVCIDTSAPGISAVSNAVDVPMVP